MRIGGIGYIDKGGIIQLPQEILPSFSIHNGIILSGIYYPHYNENNKTESHDFCISPIPYEFWPVTAKLIIKVKQQSKALKAICKQLYENEINILHSSSIRTGHRYSIIDLYIAFESLLKPGINLSFVDKVESGHYYEETKDELERTVITIAKECESYLYRDLEDIDLNNPIVGKINTALHFFFNKSKESMFRNQSSNNSSKNESSIYSPFTLRFKEGQLIEEFAQISSNTGGKIADIINKISPEEEGKDKKPNNLLPSICFVSADSHYLNLRIVIVPGSKKRNFFKLDIFYQRFEEPNTTKGLLYFILNNFSPRYKIWKYFNQLYECRKTYGAGKLTFFIEDDQRNFENQLVLEDIEQYIKFLNSALPPHLKYLKLSAKAENIYPQNAKEKFRSYYYRSTSKKYDIFLSYSYKNNKEAEKICALLTESGCSVFMAQHVLQAGDSPDSIIKQELRDSRELCLLYSPDSEESQWVMTEWAVAWALEKKIVPILLEMHPKHVKNRRLFEVQYIKYHDEEELKKYAKEAFIRRYEFLFQTGTIF